MAYRTSSRLIALVLCSVASLCDCFFWPWYTKNDPMTASNVPVDKVENTLPLAPTHYPEAMQGMLWMDQAGVLAHTDVPHAAPDLALSFGDISFSTLDTKTRTIKVNTNGPAWQWMNNAEAYGFTRVGRLLGYHYTFVWNEDYTFCYVKPTVTLPLIGMVSVPTWMMSFTMVKQKHEPGQCPPKKGATPKEYSACAEWDRQTYNLQSYFFPNGIVHYYVFKIVDGDGNRIQPYYDAYLNYARTGAKPDPDEAKRMNILVEDAVESFTLMPPPVVRYSKNTKELDSDL